MSAEHSRTFPKLTNDNYYNWKFNMRMSLIGKDLWEIVEGTETLPEDANEDRRRRFRKRENHALSSICLSVSESLQIYIREAKSAKEAWECLSGHFEEKTLSRKIMLRRKLYHTVLGKGDMTTHINNIKTVAENLQNLDDGVSEKDLVMVLMISLPESYNNLITALETLDETKLTWNYVRDRLITEFDRRKSKKSEKDDALIVDGDYRKRNRKFQHKGSENKNQQQQTKFKCHYCHKKGHFIKDCKEKAAAEAAGSAKGKQSASFCKVDELRLDSDDDDGFEFALNSAEIVSDPSCSSAVEFGAPSTDESTEDVNDDLQFEGDELDESTHDVSITHNTEEIRNHQPPVLQFSSVDVVRDAVGDRDLSCPSVKSCSYDDTDFSQSGENSSLSGVDLDTHGLEEALLPLSSGMLSFPLGDLETSDVESFPLGDIETSDVESFPLGDLETSDVESFPLGDFETSDVVSLPSGEFETDDVISLQPGDFETGTTEESLQPGDLETGIEEAGVISVRVSLLTGDVKQTSGCVSLLSGDPKQSVVESLPPGDLETGVDAEPLIFSDDSTTEVRPEACSLQPEEAALQAGDEDDSEETTWWLDSGATSHMTGERDDFSTFEDKPRPGAVSLADKSEIASAGRGDIRANIFSGSDKKIPILLKNVLYVPGLKRRLLSISAFTESGAVIIFQGSLCTIIINEKKYELGHKHGKLWKLNNVATCCSVVTTPTEDKSTLSLWHQRFGHVNKKDVEKLHTENLVDGMNLVKVKITDDDCEGCAVGKSSRLPFPKSGSKKSSGVLDLVHSDVCGPLNIPSVGGSIYFLTFIDDYSNYVSVYMLKRKREVFEKFIEFLAMAENFTGKRLKKFRSDNGGEYISDEFDKYLKKRGILTEPTVPYTPQQNGKAERLNRTILDNVRSMLHHAKLPKRWWAEAVAACVYLRNRSPTSSFKGATPYERWHGVKSNVEPWPT